MSSTSASVDVRRMPFGKHKGVALPELSDHYLSWLFSLPDLRPPLRDWVEEEFLRRCREAPLPAAVGKPPLRTTELIEAGFAVLARMYRPHTQEALEARAWLLQRVAEPERTGVDHV